jgi:aminopeptidase N
VKRLALLATLAAACGDNRGAPDAGPIAPTEDLTRDILTTDLAVDLAAMTATATITLAPSPSNGASFEVGDLTIDAVTMNDRAGAPLAWTDTAMRLDVGVPANVPLTIVIQYHWHYWPGQEGASSKGWTLTWPYWCGHLFPCHSDPADGVRFTMHLANVPAGDVAVYPTEIPADAPSYQLAWTLAPYKELDLGTTTAGTHLHAWYQDPHGPAAMLGTADSLDAFDWLEQTLGPYSFGSDVGSVEVNWGGGAIGGMEHHPYWHISSGSMGDPVTHVHESAHGWFGDGVRIACWEDFVLSEGTVSYLAARAIEATQGQAAGDQVWAKYQAELGALSGTEPVYPDGCDTHDILQSGLFTNAPYMRGAYFYSAVAQRIGETELDQVLASFYAKHRGQAAHMSDMLDEIQAVSGYDPTACAQAWLKASTVPAPGPCP